MSNVIPNSAKPVGSLTTLDKVVDSAMIDIYDDTGTMYERYLHWVWRCWKEELSNDVFRRVKRVKLPVNQSSRTVKYPMDMIDYTYIGIIDQNNKLHALSENNLLTPPGIDDSATKSSCKCQCGTCSSELCSDMYRISMTEETVQNGTKITKTRVCLNGDVMQEITEPVEVATAITTCDYAIEMVKPCRACTYTLTLPDPGYPLTSVKYKKNGEFVFVSDLANSGELDTLMESLGFTIIGGATYRITGTCDIWEEFTYIEDGDTEPETIYFDQSDCEDETTIGMPYTINSYVKNGTVISVNTTISNQGELDDFFSGIGFTKNDDENYSISGTTDEYTSMLITQGDNVFSISFTQSNCNTEYSKAIEIQTREEKICEVTVSPCGCIQDTEQNRTTLSCCNPLACYPVCWNSWGGWCEQTQPYPTNGYGTYKMIDELGIIQLNTHFAYTQLYLEYYSDGLYVNGNYYVHIFAKPALIAYAHWKAIENKKNVPLYEKERKKQEWVAERGRSRRRISRATLDELYDIVRTLPII